MNHLGQQKPFRMESRSLRHLWLYSLPHFLTSHSLCNKTLSATCHINELCSQTLRRLTLGLRGGKFFAWKQRV